MLLHDHFLFGVYTETRISEEGNTLHCVYIYTIIIYTECQLYIISHCSVSQSLL